MRTVIGPGPSTQGCDRRESLEPFHLRCNRNLGRQAFHRGSAEETIHVRDAAQDVCGVLRFRYRPAVAEYQHLRVGGLARVNDAPDEINRFIHRPAALRADGVFTRLPDGGAPTVPGTEPLYPPDLK